ncbi:MAG: YraN family protein [Ilumatobacteraceae bacterium]
MGVGHVSKEPIRAARAGTQFQGSEHRRTGAGRSVSSAARIARGRWAEELTARWYKRNGYRVIARNWRCPRGELDVVAVIGDELVVCEVKARASTAFGTPAEAVTLAKQLRLRRATSIFLTDLRSKHSLVIRHVRFDVACVLGSRLEIVTDAF